MTIRCLEFGFNYLKSESKTQCFINDPKYYCIFGKSCLANLPFFLPADKYFFYKETKFQSLGIEVVRKDNSLTGRKGTNFYQACTMALV